MDIGIIFEHPLGLNTSMGMDIDFENRYGCALEKFAPLLAQI